MKPDGHEVSPNEHVECAKEVQVASKDEVSEEGMLARRIEQGLLDKGYHRRPWWLLNDLH